MILIETLMYLILTVYGESNGEPDLGIQKVAEVVMNRADRRNLTVAQVVQEPQQFECWSPDTKTTLDYHRMIYVSKIVAKVYFSHERNTGGPDHFHSTSIEPEWSKHPKMIFLYTIGNHRFYRWEE